MVGASTRPNCPRRSLIYSPRALTIRMREPLLNDALPLLPGAPRPVFSRPKDGDGIALERITTIVNIDVLYRYILFAYN